MYDTRNKIKKQMLKLGGAGFATHMTDTGLKSIIENSY